MRQLTLWLALAALTPACDSEPAPTPGAPNVPGAPWSPPAPSTVATPKACYGPVEAGIALPPAVEPEIESVEGSAREFASDTADRAEVASVDDAEALPGSGDVPDGVSAEAFAEAPADGTGEQGAEVTESDVGVTEVTEVTESDAGDVQDASSDTGGPSFCPTCQGEPFPEYALADFQPQSCSHRRAYGLDAFTSRPTVAVLLAAW